MTSHIKLASILTIALATTMSFGLQAAEKQSLPGITIIGQSEEEINKIPGSVGVVSEEDIKKSQPMSSNEALRKVSSVYVRDEGGLGLIQNISLRGIPGERSRKVLSLEDGVPISLAPYGENATYYAPNIDRISRIEVLKGSGSILYGPQTVGGVVNYITAAPYDTPGFGYGITLGSHDYRNYQLRAGGTWDQVASDISAVYKEGDGPRDPMPYSVFDIAGKLEAQLNDEHSIKTKLHYYNQDAALTYIGLTQGLYDENAYQNPAIDDRFYVERAAASVTHSFDNGELKADTTLYTYYTRRDWWRQDFQRTSTNAAIRVSGTDGDDSGNTIYWLDSNGGRNRDYRVVGIEPRFEIGNWKTGFKLHYEFENNRRINGESSTARSGVLDDDEQRSTTAYAAYALYEHYLSDTVRITPGLRVETFNQTRHIIRRNEALVDAKESTGFETAWIPGIGITADASDTTTYFAGIHRGFTPPRFSTAINSSAVDQQLDAEESWNYEAGLRTKLTNWLDMSGSVFLYDYDNQIVDASNSNFDVANAGETTHQGAEIELTATHKNEAANSEIITRLNLTTVSAEFDNGANEGNKIPYTPEFLASLSFDFRFENKYGIFVEGVFVDEMFSDDANTEAASANGQVGKIDSHNIWNVTATYQHDDNTTYFVSAKNIFDEKYIASRRQQGIQVGHPQQINFGVKVNL